MSTWQDWVRTIFERRSNVNRAEILEYSVYDYSYVQLELSAQWHRQCVKNIFTYPSPKQVGGNPADNNFNIIFLDVNICFSSYCRSILTSRDIIKSPQSGVTLCFQFVSPPRPRPCPPPQPQPPQWLLLPTSKPFELDLRYLGPRKYRFGKMYWMTFWWPWHKVTAVTLINKNCLSAG